MILGMSTATFTFLHVLVSLIGIGTGGGDVRIPARIPYG
jgi:hypothetical protein